MSAADDFLVEIGTEELPPKALHSLMRAFGENLEAAVDEARLAHGRVHAYASPRRLSVLIEELALGQEDRKITQKGPPVSVAFDKDGKLKAAGSAFASITPGVGSSGALISMPASRGELAPTSGTGIPFNNVLLAT